MDNTIYIIEAKKRIKERITKDNIVIFFARVLEDIKKEKDSNLFGRVKDIYLLINPYGELCENKIYDYFTKKKFKIKEGMDLNDEEKNYIQIFINELKKDFHLKNQSVMKGRINGIINKLCEKYMTESIKYVEPFLLCRLIAHVGGIERFSKLPSSTIQLIGSENAMFKYKNKGPKYGLIYNSKFVQSEKNKGKAARQLANKIAITIKQDYYKNIAR